MSNRRQNTGRVRMDCEQEVFLVCFWGVVSIWEAVFGVFTSHKGVHTKQTQTHFLASGHDGADPAQASEPRPWACQVLEAGQPQEIEPGQFPQRVEGCRRDC